MAALPQNFPNPAGPIVDPTTGRMTGAFQALLQTIWQRTGGATGEDTSDTPILASGALQKQNSLSDVQSKARARQNLELTAAAQAETVHGWTAPTGAVSRSALNAGWTGTAAATYTQSEAQAVVTQVQALSRATGALIEDLVTYGALSYGS